MPAKQEVRLYNLLVRSKAVTAFFGLFFDRMARPGAPAHSKQNKKIEKNHNNYITRIKTALY